MKMVKLTEEHYVLVDDTRKEMYTIPTSQAKELLGVVDKAFERYPIIENDKDHNDRNYYRRSAYYQALEDNKEKKYTEEDMKKMFVIGGGLSSFNDTDDNKFKYALTHIQPKTEWEVEMVDGKLKLKS